MKQLTIYRCKTCGNLICMLEDSGVVPVCCGEEMEKLSANTVDASIEKHIPVIQQNGTQVKVFVGESAHPMLADHYIEWVIIITNKGFYGRSLSIGDQPEAIFEIESDEEVLSAYAFCNIHGLWVKKVKDTQKNQGGGLL